MPLGLSWSARNDVVRIGNAGSRVHDLNGGLVEDVRTEQLTEVSGAHERRGHFQRGGCGVIVVVLYPLLSKQEEEFPAILVEVAGNEDGAIEVPAVLVVAERLRIEAGVIALPGVGIERVVAKVFKGAAVKSPLFRSWGSCGSVRPMCGHTQPDSR